MSLLPFPFLSAPPIQLQAVAHLGEINIFHDTQQPFYIAQAQFCLDQYHVSQFETLGVDYPSSMHNSVPKRQAEFLAGRYLCQVLLRHSKLFQAQPPQIYPGELRAPLWPAPTMGSISHHKHMAYVALLTRSAAKTQFVGIDTELWLDDTQTNHIGASIHLPIEQQRLISVGFSAAQATTLIFSAKEALFKAICPFVQAYFGFESAEVIAISTEYVEPQTGLRAGWLQLQLTTDWVIAKAPQQHYDCWFFCSKDAVVTLICSESTANMALLSASESQN
jgi:enterobactin synthetase component D